MPHDTNFSKGIKYSQRTQLNLIQFITIAPNDNKCNLKALKRYSPIQANYNLIICSAIKIQFIKFQIGPLPC